MDCTLVHSGVLWPTCAKRNVPTTADVQEVPRSHLEINRMESSYGARNKSFEDGLKPLV